MGGETLSWLKLAEGPGVIQGSHIGNAAGTASRIFETLRMSVGAAHTSKIETGDALAGLRVRPTRTGRPLGARRAILCLPEGSASLIYTVRHGATSGKSLLALMVLS
jgi:hypothetical protein